MRKSITNAIADYLTECQTLQSKTLQRQTSQKLSPDQREEAFRLLDEGYRSGRWPGSLASTPSRFGGWS